ncbi:unnamed protein product [Closterium sp. Naga37s-1]|nr:unnamed protein product [Closterium sp. Naga37s-1]
MRRRWSRSSKVASLLRHRDQSSFRRHPILPLAPPLSSPHFPPLPFPLRSAAYSHSLASPTSHRLSVSFSPFRPSVWAPPLQHSLLSRSRATAIAIKVESGPGSSCEGCSKLSLLPSPLSILPPPLSPSRPSSPPRRVAIWRHLRVFYAHVAMSAQLISAPSGQARPHREAPSPSTPHSCFLTRAPPHSLHAALFFPPNFFQSWSYPYFLPSYPLVLSSLLHWCMCPVLLLFYALISPFHSPLPPFFLTLSPSTSSPFSVCCALTSSATPGSMSRRHTLPPTLPLVAVAVPHASPHHRPRFLPLSLTLYSVVDHAPPPVAFASSHRRPRFLPPSPLLPPTVAFASSNRRFRFLPPSPSLPPTVALASSHRRPRFLPPSPSLPPTVALASSHRRPRFLPPSPSLPPTVALASSHRRPRFLPPSPSLPPTLPYTPPSAHPPFVSPSFFLILPSSLSSLPPPFLLSSLPPFLSSSLPPSALLSASVSFSPLFPLSSLPSSHPLFRPSSLSPLLISPSSYSLFPASLAAILSSSQPPHFLSTSPAPPALADAGTWGPLRAESEEAPCAEGRREEQRCDAGAREAARPTGLRRADAPAAPAAALPPAPVPAAGETGAAAAAGAAGAAVRVSAGGGGEAPMVKAGEGGEKVD